jgi:hypothetical protein
VYEAFHEHVCRRTILAPRLGAGVATIGLCRVPLPGRSRFVEQATPEVVEQVAAWVQASLVFVVCPDGSYNETARAYVEDQWYLD